MRARLICCLLFLVFLGQTPVSPMSTLSTLSTVNDQPGPPIVGVKIYEYRQEFPQLFRQWKQMGINTAFVSLSLASDREFMALAKKNNIPVFIILPTFYNPAALKKEPALAAITGEGKKAVDEWVEFVCPNRPEFRKKHLDFIKETVNSCQPDGISIDFIRYFVFWEKVYPDTLLNPLHNTCFCPHCLETMQKELFFKFPSVLKSVPEKAAWVLKYHKEKWADWKNKLIVSMIKDIISSAKSVKTDVLTNVHIVPWKQDDFNNGRRFVTAQDIAAISPLVNYISPMCYAHMVKQSPKWIHEVVKDLHKYSGQNSIILPSIQVQKAYLKEILTPAIFNESLQQALKAPSGGVIFWNWKALEQNREKLKTAVIGQ